MNGVIHIFAAIASVVLVVLIVRLQQRRDFLLQLLKSQAVAIGAMPLRLGAPSQFLAEFSRALGIAFVSTLSSTEPMVRINPRVWTETFLCFGLGLIRCGKDAGTGRTEVQVRLLKAAPNDRDLAGELAAALGGNVKVVISLSNDQS